MKRTIQKAMSVGIVAMLLTSCGNESVTERPEEMVSVKTLTVEQTSQAEGRKYSATIEENTGTEVSFARAGTVMQVYVKNGQKVQKGQLLASLDATTLQNAYNVSLSMLTQAQDAYQRMQQLYASNSISEMQWVEVQTRLDQAKSSEQIARRALDDARLTAPASGIIADKNVEAGQNIIPGMAMMKIVEINKVKVNISVPEKEVSAISEGTEVDVCVHALGDLHFKGQISEKNISANVLSRTYNIKAIVDNPEHRLIPGMICEARVVGEEVADGVIALPVDAVQLSNKNFYFVWIDQNGLAQKRYVTVGNVTAKGVTIRDGLQVGDKVIVEGQQKVSEGMKIMVKGEN